MTTVSSPADRPHGPIDSHTAAADPRTTFLTREELYTRHGYARSRGYQHVADLLADAAFPRPLGERWRLDHIEAWEDHYALQGLRQAAASSLVTPFPAHLTEAPGVAKRGPGRPKRAVA